MTSFRDFPWRYWQQQRSQATALIIGRQALSWQQLNQQVNDLAAGFWHQGLRPGMGVALRAPNSEPALLAWLALIQCGARILPLNPQLPDGLLAQLLPTLDMHFSLALANNLPLTGYSALAMRPTPGPQPACAWQPARPLSMTLTSGSTGLPKAAVHSATAHLASAAGVLGLMPLAAGDRYLLSLPLFHVSGQGIMWRWLLRGATLVIRTMHPLVEALADCTHASLVPTQLWRLLEQPQAVSLQAVLLGGAEIPLSLTEAATRRGIRCYCGYGLTELASTVCAKLADGSADVGEPLAGREVKIVDDEIWLRATSMACGYWRSGGIAPFTDEDGWFATRDRGVMQAGRLTVLGRLDNQFFSGGEGIQPEALERIISRHPQVLQVFIVPRADPEFGQRPVALVSCQGVLSELNLAQWVSDKLARFQQPVAWLELPTHLSQGGIKMSRQTLIAWVNAASEKPDAG